MIYTQLNTMDTDIENLNTRLRALILKKRENYAHETLDLMEHYLLEVMDKEEVKLYMENARKIVFKND